MNRAKRTLLLLALMLLALAAGAQERQVVVADKVTRQPVGQASLYTKEDGRFHSAISNAHGQAVVRFGFRRLTVSHLNYERLTLRHLPDTVWLTPRYQTTAEVVVTNQEPAWIRPMLKRFVREKSQKYFSRRDTLACDYRTQTIGVDRLYRFRATGLLCRLDEERLHWAVALDSALIVAVDSTRLTDTENLRRMLYEDFVAELDNGFIRSHRFSENGDYEGRSPSEIELFFRSKSRSDDRGRLVIDTARCVVLSAVRTTGTKTNMHERMSQVLYQLARVITGYAITSWHRDYRVTYAEHDGWLYPAEVRYKTHLVGRDGTSDDQEAEFQRQRGGGFPNMEAVLTLRPGQAGGERATWEELPENWYIRYGTDAQRQRDVQLSNLPAQFEIFEE